MNELIKAIEEASVVIPHEFGIYPNITKIPYAYQQGVLAGRKQALEIIEQFLGTKKEGHP